MKKQKKICFYFTIWQSIAMWHNITTVKQRHILDNSATQKLPIDLVRSMNEVMELFESHSDQSVTYLLYDCSTHKHTYAYSRAAKLWCAYTQTCRWTFVYEPAVPQVGVRMHMYAHCFDRSIVLRSICLSLCHIRRPMFLKGAAWDECCAFWHFQQLFLLRWARITKYEIFHWIRIKFSSKNKNRITNFKQNVPFMCNKKCANSA